MQVYSKDMPRLSISITKSNKEDRSRNRNRGTDAFLQHRSTKVLMMDRLGRLSKTNCADVFATHKLCTKNKF